jgi:hypothetical protein
MGSRLILAAMMLASATPAWASDHASVPEGSQLMLFALALLGVIVGRRASARKPGEDSERD